MSNEITTIISIISLVIAILSLLSSIFYNSKANKREDERRAEEKRLRQKEKIKNRPQFKVTEIHNNFEQPGYVKDELLDFDLLFLPYDELDCDTSNFTPLYKLNGVPNVKGKCGNKKPICKYKDIYSKRNEWVSYVIEFENIGATNIAFYYILNTQDKVGSIIDIKTDYTYQILQQYNGCEHIVTPQKNNNRPGDRIKVRINFHKDFVLYNPISSCLAFNFETEDGEFWQQGIFFTDKEDNQSHQITGKEFSDYYRGEFLDAVMYDRIYWSKINNQ